MSPRDRLLAALVAVLAMVAIVRFSETAFGGGWPCL
jgi:hypothetical protein